MRDSSCLCFRATYAFQTINKPTYKKKRNKSRLASAGPPQVRVVNSQPGGKLSAIRVPARASGAGGRAARRLLARKKKTRATRSRRPATSLSAGLAMHAATQPFQRTPCDKYSRSELRSPNISEKPPCNMSRHPHRTCAGCQLAVGCSSHLWSHRWPVSGSIQFLSAFVFRRMGT